MFIKPGMVIPTTHPTHTNGWTFTIVVGGHEMIVKDFKAKTQHGAKACMRALVRDLNQENIETFEQEEKDRQEIIHQQWEVLTGSNERPDSEPTEFFS